MLELKNIVKTYTVGDNTIRALDGVSIQFRESEFVAVLGHSGCGKTTLLNIIGGLDQYTSGDLIINGVSTKDYKSRDWDAYRNHSIGFVFQNYNLIPHLTVLANVELALTISGVGKTERRRRAKEALEQVGLGDQLTKKPNQLSGGQMQRVAIARALVNNPDILLADEPTGALDSETSIQVMEILKEVAKDKLVIMVTHNPDLAETYATRIVRIKDGRLTGDSDPYAPPAAKAPAKMKTSRVSMSIWTAFSLSLRNLVTKKARTFLTAFAGSIGIIGIALILSLSNGINNYIVQVQEDTLTSYPITIEAESVDMTAMLSSLMGAGQNNGEEHDRDQVYASTVMYDLLDSMVNAETVTNNLEDFKAYLDQGGGGIADLATIQYSYDLQFDIYSRDADGNIVKSDVTALMQEAMTTLYGGDYSSYFDSMGSMYESFDVWEELLPGDDGALIADQVKDDYELLYGAWPENYDEVILFIDENNEVSDLMLYTLGLLPADTMDEALLAVMNGETPASAQDSWTYEELCNTEFKLLLPSEYYQYDAASETYVNLAETATGLDLLYNSGEAGIPLKVVGVARSTEGSGSMLSGSVGYTNALTTYAIEAVSQSPVIQDQLENPDIDVLTGLPFPTEESAEPTDAEKAEAVTGYLETADDNTKAAAYVDAMSQPASAYVDQVVQEQMEGLTREAIEEMILQQYADQMGVDASTIRAYIAEMSDEQLFSQVEEAIRLQVQEQYAAAVAAQFEAVPSASLAAQMDAALALGADADGGLTTEQFVYLYDNYMPPTVSDSSYTENLDLLGYVDLDSPSTISLYATTFANKDAIADRIADYNAGRDEEDQITYTDYVALLMSSITDIISGISYVLIAFVAISLIVSSIMIGIITYISVLERTREIGILRSIGASKRDISNVFNAETLIVGLAAGLIGIGVSLLLTIPLNAVIHNLTGITSMGAQLPPAAGVILVLISMVLTFVAGLIPSRIAARKDPVEALRTE